MKRFVLVGLLLAFVSSGSAPAPKQSAHEFACTTDAECEAEWQEVYG